MSAQDSQVAFLVSPEGIEQLELTEPWKAVTEAGGVPRLVSTRPGEVRGFHHLDPADTFPVDVVAGETSATDYDALVLPGGVANGDRLRMDARSVKLVKDIADAGKPIAVICHGGWILIEAGVVQGRRMTSWPSMQTDFRNAGAEWVDEEAVVDVSRSPALISSRKPDDLPAFIKAFLAQL